MSQKLKRGAALLALLLVPLVTPAADSGFLPDYGRLPPPVGGEGGGTDRVYIAPGAIDKLAKYDAVMVDMPEVFISPDSPYKGAKPDDLKAIAGMVRKEIASELQEGGYRIADAAGPTVLYLRPAVTNLALEKKKRGLLAYTPIGFVVNAGVRAIQDLMEKYDIVGLDLEVEISDSTTSDLIGEAVLKRGAMKDKDAGIKEKRLSFDEFQETLENYAARMRCRLDNGKLPAEQRIDCLDPKAREARAQQKKS